MADKEASGDSAAAAEAKKDVKKKHEDAILVVVTLIITLTYQALLNPPSTLFSEGSQVDWGCLGKHLGRGLIKGMKKCPAGLAFAFLFINTTVFLISALILALTLRGRGAFLSKTLTIFVTVSYCILLMAFSYETAYVAIPLCCVAFSFFSFVIWINDGTKAMLMRIIMNPRQGLSELWALCQNQETEARENKMKGALGKSASAEAKNDDKKNFEDAILFAATLITTLTYQALLSPPSTLYNEGNQIDWGCLGKNPGRGLIKGMRECPAGLTFAFLFLNSLIFLNSILILVVILPGRYKLFNPFGFLLGSLTINLTVSYSILLMAFSNYTAYVAIPLCCVAFLVFLVLNLQPWQLLAAYQDETRRRQGTSKSVGNPEAPKIKGVEALRELAGKINKKDMKEFEDAILVVVTLIITLTYQALSSPPSTLYNKGSEIEWGCLGKNQGRGLIKGMKECPAGLAFAFLFINTTIFLTSILILALTLRRGRGFLLGVLMIFLMISYCILLMAFSYYTAYVAIPLCCLSFVACLFLLKRMANTN